MGRNISLIMAMLFSIVANAQISFSLTEPVEENGDWLVNICMNNGSTKVTGFQCDLTISSDFSYEMGSYAFTDRCKKMKQGKLMETHNLTGEGVTNGGTIRIDVYSNDIEEIQDIQGTDGAVVTLHLSGLSTAKAKDFNLTNIVVVTLDDDGFPGVEAIHPKAVIKDSTLTCYDVMGSEILVIGELTEQQKTEMNNCIKTATTITSVDLSRCTNENLGTLPLKTGSDPVIYLATKDQVTNKTTNMYYKKNGMWAVGAIDLVDGTASYSLERTVLAESGSYTRNFKNTNWQAWYIPFTIPVESVSEDLDFAQIIGVSEDEESITFHTNYVTEGNIKANTPYFVMAKATGSRKMEWTDVKASKTVINSKTFTTDYSTFTFTGTYSVKTDMYANGSYALSGGELAKPSKASVTLGTFRWFMDYSTTANARKRCVLSFDDYVDGITTVKTNTDGVSQIYDLQGRPVKAMGKGIYIINGKKLVK